MRRGSVLALGALLASAGTIRGQAIQKPAGEVGLEGAGLWVGFPREAGLRRFDSWQWFNVSLDGTVWDPGLVSFRLGVGPRWRQTALSGLPEPTDQGAWWWGWNAGADILAASPLNVSVSTVRSTSTVRAGFGTENRQYLTTGNAKLRYRNPSLPMELEYRADNRDEYWLVGPREWRGQQLSLDALRFVARNRKLALTLERDWINDRAAGTSYLLDRDDLRHALAWGKGSRLSTRFGYLERTGDRAYRVRSWTESAHLQHTRTISTDYRIDLGSQRVLDAPVHSRLLDGSLSYQATPGLRAVVGGHSRSTTYAGGREGLQQLRSRLDYRAAPLAGVRLTTGLSLGYEWRGLEPSGDEWLAVADEPHVVDASGRFSLNNPQIDRGSVTVSSAARTLLYEPGLDYQPVEGLPSVEILVLPGGRIAIGDTLLVSYRYQPFPSVRAVGFTGGYDAVLNVHGFEVYHRRTLRDVGESGGAASAGAEGLRVASWFGDYHETVVGVRYSEVAALGAVDVGAERSERSIGDSYRATVSQLRGSLTALPLDNVRGTLAGSASRTNTDPAGEFTMVSVSSSIGWSPVASLQLQGTLAMWQWSQDAVRNSQFVGGDLEVLWQPGLLTIDLRYSRNAWQDGAERTDDRLSLRASRRF